MKILIADDSPTHRPGLSRLAEKMGYAAIQACDGGATVELYERERGSEPLSGTCGDSEALQRAADAALYRAMREGKNRTVVAGGA